MNTVKQTLKEDLCINCGICKTVCARHAIKMVRNKYGELNPCIDVCKCNRCGACYTFCPNTKEKLQALSERIVSVREPHAYGLENAAYYVAWDLDTKQRQKCCSGGIVTKLAAAMLKTGQIDGMIHVERVWAHRGGLHYGARLSRTVEEIQEHVSSAYQPVCFSDVLSLLHSGKTYFMTGTPCVIRGVKHLFEKNPAFKNIRLITCALVCSHNTNAQFIDFLTQLNNVPDTDEWKVNIRHKDDSIPDANNFKNYIYTKDTVLLDKNRFSSGWTDIWRSYYFAMGACLKCPDFWGGAADVSVKDAWGTWAADPLGKSLVVIRNKKLEETFLKLEIGLQSLDYQTMQDHQKQTSVFKQTESYHKNFKPWFAKVNRRNGLLKFLLISKSSKFLYRFFGYQVTKKLMPLAVWLGGKGEKL